MASPAPDSKDSFLPHTDADPFGFDPHFFARVRPLAEFMYRKYWRVHTEGVENVPDDGAAILVANHSGAIPLDATMLVTAVHLEQSKHRVVRFLYDHFVSGMPLIGTAYNRLGAAEATLQNGRTLLERGDVIGLFPEGVAGVAKGFRERYHLQPFHTGFVRLSIQEHVPVIPAAVVGAEETYPVIGKLQSLGPLRGLLSVPYLPVTPLFPLMGPVGMIPLPTRWTIRFGKPLRLFERKDLSENATEPAIRSCAERVRRRIQAMLHEMLAGRESMF